ncbi:MAG: hypothetical protein KatS3mg009_0315 [Acidimicrobiia bacterium]|nr:MAG: hypothetical protein KatS3mg009_0315 [Acidimicrobiia bacterium]
MPGALLVHDEGPGVGLGHRRRMEALAAALTAHGVGCRVAPLDGAGPLHAPVVVVDSYRHRADTLDTAAQVLVALDDLRRDLAVDLLVDPSPGADASVHRRAARVLAGAGYSLVPAVPAAMPPAAVVPAGAPATRVLVTTGAADGAGVGARVAAGLAELVPGTEVRLVVGPWGAPDVPEGVVAVRAPAGLAGELAAAPLVVTAGGVTMLEACVLGRAVVAMALSEDQRLAVAALAAAGAVVAADAPGAAAAAAALVPDTGRRARLGAAAARTVDGGGAERVAGEIVRLLAGRGRP